MERDMIWKRFPEVIVIIKAYGIRDFVHFEVFLKQLAKYRKIVLSVDSLFSTENIEKQ